MQQFYINLKNNDNESVTVKVRSLVQVTNMLQKNLIPMSEVDRKHSTIKMQLDVNLQTVKDGSTLYPETVAKFAILLEDYNGLDVHTVSYPKESGYVWESSYASFKNEQTAVAHLVALVMEYIRKEMEKDEQEAV